MKTLSFTKFPILCLCICFLLFGCASPQSVIAPTPIPAITDTQLPMAVPYGMLPTTEGQSTASGGNGQSILQVNNLHTLCTLINVNYAMDLPQALHDLLEVMGYQVNSQNTSCDALLEIQMTGEALSGQYKVDNTNEYRTCYNGARFTGVIKLTAPDAIPMVETVNDGFPPPTLIDENNNEYCRDAQGAAPYEKVWPIALIHGLKPIFGDDVVIGALQVPAFQNTEGMLDPAPYSETLKQGLIGLMENPDPAIRRQAIELIRYMRPVPEEIIIAVAPQLNNEQSNSGLWSILVDAGPVAKAALPQIISILNSTPDLMVRRNAILTIGNIGSPAQSAAPALVVALQDSETIIRLLAAESLGKIMAPTEVAVQPLINACWDVDNYVRQAAVLSLSQITNQPENSSWGCNMWQDWWSTLPTATP